MLFLKIKINKVMTFPRFLQECDNVLNNFHVWYLQEKLLNIVRILNLKRI